MSRVGQGSILGGDPQDLKYQGEETWVEIGEGTVIREYSTINRGTAAAGVTQVGRSCFIMSYVHLAHDCHIGDGVIIANGTQLAGHVTIHDRAILSGLVAVHQFVTIGTYAFVGGMSRVNQDIPPYVKAVGNPIELYGLNSIGLQRAGFSRRYHLRAQAPLPALLQLRAQPLPGDRARPGRPPGVSRGRALPGLRFESQRARRSGLTMAALPVGVIGVGALGRHHARHLAAAPDARLVGVHDADPARAAKIAAELKTRFYDDLDALLRDVEAVTVAVPTPAHCRGRDSGAGAGARS